MAKTEVAEQWGVVDENGRSVGRKVHTFKDCSSIKGNTAVELSVGEVALLGLMVCSVCEKRAAGGPALDVLEEFFASEANPTDGAGDLAWALQEFLRGRGFYIAHRQPKAETNGNAE